MLLLFNPQKSHQRASAEAMNTYKSIQLSVPLGQSAGVRGQRYKRFLKRQNFMEVFH